MMQSTDKKFFDSEGTWPFLLRQTELDDCLRFLCENEPAAPRILRIFGPSGGGKSFLTRELLVKYAENFSGSPTVYVDIPPSDLEASDLFGKIDLIISTFRTGDRVSPSSVSKKFSNKWCAKKKLPTASSGTYLYRVFRDLLTLIPLVGSVIKAFLPTALPQQSNSATDPMSAFRFLLEQSHTQPVLLALDNIQFLSTSMLEILGGELLGCGDRLRFVVVERTIGNKRNVQWTPSIPHLIEKTLVIGFGSQADVQQLVSYVLPTEIEGETLAATVFRRSGGNLKSAWFQLKLIAERRAFQRGEGVVESYQDVIQSLRPTDQMVLRFIVFLLGGLSVSAVIALFKASHLGLGTENVTTAISDLTALGLLIVNGESNDSIRVEHEIVSSVVTALTPEDEKLELRAHLVSALSEVLDNQAGNEHDDVLYDRLIGIVHEQEVRASASLQSHLVSFIYAQNTKEKFSYLCGLYRDSVCWDVVDILPPDCVRILLNAVQKCSLFSFGLVATQQLQKDPKYKRLAALYSAKYLVQMFRYEDAVKALAAAEPSKEKDAIEFNILINLCEDKKAAAIANRILASRSNSNRISEFELVVLRNAGHLFPPGTSRIVLTAAIRGFTKLGNKFGVATTLNNLGVVELADGQHAEAKTHLEQARHMLIELDSREVYQPLVNLGALAAVTSDLVLASTLAQDARRFVPRSLAMDMVMLDFNDAVLTLCSGRIDGESTVEAFRKLYSAAVKTRDLRFIEIVAWFTASLEAQLSDRRTIEYSTAMIEHIQKRSTAGIEIFVEIEVNGKKINAPFILSPHWRY